MRHRLLAAALIALVMMTMAACGDSGSSKAVPTASPQPSATPTPTSDLTPTFGPSPTASPTSCVGVAPSVDPIDSPTARRAVTVSGRGVTCGANKRVIIEGPRDEFIIEDCVMRDEFSVQVRLNVGVNHISVCQFSLCPSVCTEIEVVRR